MGGETLLAWAALIVGSGGLAGFVGLYYRFKVEGPKTNVDRQAQIIDDVSAENVRLRTLVVDALAKDETIVQLRQDVANLSARVSVLEGTRDQLKNEKKLLIAQVVELGGTPIVT